MLIDLTSISSERELHELLASSLGFPDFYGKNWDAFWDCITGLVTLPPELHFVGSNELQKTLPRAMGKLKSCFDDLAAEYPSIRCDVTWE